MFSFGPPSSTIQSRQSWRILKLAYALYVQVLLFTATMPIELEETAQQWQQKPVVLHVSVSGASISRSVVQVSVATILQIAWRDNSYNEEEYLFSGRQSDDQPCALTP